MQRMTGIWVSMVAASTVMAGIPVGTNGIPGYMDSPLVPGTQWHKHDPRRPQPAVVESKKDGAPPSDAIVLFNGGDLSQFQPTPWKVKDGVLVAGDGGLTTKQAFGDFQLHLEWRGPIEDMDNWGNQGNNGVMLMGRYEIQIFDSHSTKIYADGQAGAVYGQNPPLVNVTRPRGEWQTYDIVFIAPKFDGDKVVSPPRVTVFFNGVLVQHDVAILGPTGHRNVVPLTPHPERLPLSFGGHHCPVEFRNMWIREIRLP